MLTASIYSGILVIEWILMCINFNKLYSRVFKKKLLPFFIKTIHPSLNYGREKKFAVFEHSFTDLINGDKSLYNFGGVLPNFYDNHELEDHIWGEYNKLKIDISELILEDTDDEEDKTYTAIILTTAIPIDKKVSFALVDKENKIHTKLRNLKKCDFEQTYMNNYYKAGSNDKNLNKLFSSKEFANDLQRFNSAYPFVTFSIYNGRLYIAMEKEVALFEFDIYYKINTEILNKDFKYIKGLLKFIDLINKHLYSKVP